MSEPTEIVEDAAAIQSDAFVAVSYDDLIPNNVDLSSDKQLQRALEAWQPNYVDWWKEMGPDGFQNAEVYLRTAVGVDPSGWAKFGLTCSVGLLANVGVAAVLVRFGFHEYPAAITGIIIGSVWNFALSSKFVWGKY